MVFLVFWSRASRRPVLWVEIQPLRVAKNGIGHDRVLNGIYEGNRSGRVMGGGCVHIYIYTYIIIYLYLLLFLHLFIYLLYIYMSQPKPSSY